MTLSPIGRMHNYIFLPSASRGRQRSIDARTAARAVLDENGKPVIDKKTGKPVIHGPLTNGSTCIARCIR